jgi:endonuclease/exonuclease/phosphatase family metal-dependent hydrolase
LRVLCWNLFHGRAVPPAGRSLLAEFTQRIAGWEWDLALLQEVPPWWPPSLARAAHAEQRTALTSRNAALPLRRAIAERRPDLLKANSGGANALLVRHPISEYMTTRLRVWPERRVAQFARLAGGVCAVNVHLSRGQDQAAAELELVCTLAFDWAGDTPLILGGDFNLRAPEASGLGLAHAAASGVDHVLARGFETVAVLEAPDAGALSDHAPLLADLSFHS